jgi:hypothetical protein
LRRVPSVPVLVHRCCCYLYIGCVYAYCIAAFVVQCV